MAATDNIVDVEAVIGYRYNTDRGRDEFLIKWVNFGEDSNSWEPGTNLSDVSAELARKYQEKIDNLPHPSTAYRRQARQLLLNTFQRVSCAAIELIFFRLCKYNFTRSFHYISLINHQRTNNGNGAGQFDLIPKQVKVFVKKNRQKTQLEVTDETLLGELDDIPALNQKEGGTNTKQGAATPKKFLLEKAINLTGDSSDGDEKKEDEKECGCCFGDYPVSALKQCSAGENHNVCRDCIQRYVSEQLDGNGSTVFKCIVSAECSCEYSLAFLDQVLTPRLKKRANGMVALEEIKKAGGGDVWQCPKCAHMGFVDGKPKWVHCPECNVKYCTSCNANHAGLTCKEFQRQQTIGKDPKHLAAEAMSRACTRSCPHCGQDYMKSDGCNKIRCKCGKLSCYLCGEKIAGYSHFDRGKCQKWTNTGEMERIDQEKRQQAGRQVLLDQGITNEEEIAAILSSLDEEEDEDDQSVDTAAAVRGGRAGNQRAAAVAARPVDVPPLIEAQIGRLDAPLRDQMDLLGPNPRPQQGIEFGAAAPQRADPPAAAAGENPVFRAQNDLLGPNPPPQQGVALGAAAPAPRKAAPPSILLNPLPQQRYVAAVPPPTPHRRAAPGYQRAAAVAGNPALRLRDRIGEAAIRRDGGGAGRSQRAAGEIKTLPLIMLVILTGTIILLALFYMGEYLGAMIQKKHDEM